MKLHLYRITCHSNSEIEIILLAENYGDAVEMGCKVLNPIGIKLFSVDLISMETKQVLLTKGVVL